MHPAAPGRLQGTIIQTCFVIIQAEELLIPIAPNNLPVEIIPLVGREKEIGGILDLLQNPQAGLITLQGLGGTGKTRLAVEVGKAALELFPDGVWFVLLTPLSAPEQIMIAAAAALGFPLQSHEDPQSQLLHFLQGKRLLLIFDNLEHLLPGACLPLETILNNAGASRLLVTSRQPVGAPGEWVLPVRGLEYDASTSQPEGDPPPAVRLFLQQLDRVAGPAAGNDPACAAEICRTVQGLPLALLLAASWGRTLECCEIAGELRHGIDFLQTQQKTLPERHRSMQAVFDYSWRLLSPLEQSALRKLSVFQGGFDRAAALAVADVNLHLLDALLDRSLVERVSKDRYQIHELLRQYLRDRLAEAGEEGAARDRHLDYYTCLAGQAETHLAGKEQRAWLARLQREIDNLRAALAWSLTGEETGRLEHGLGLIAATERFWILHTYLKEGYSYSTRLLERRQEQPGRDSFQRAYARGLNVAARLAFLLEDLPAARRLAAQALQLGLELNDPRVVGDACFHQGVELVHRREFETARPLFEQARESYRQCEYMPGLSQSIAALGRVHMFNQEFLPAFSHLSTALDLARKQDDQRIIYTTLRSLGQLGIMDPQVGLIRARDYYAEALQSARELEDKQYIRMMLEETGEIARLEGDLEQAAAVFAEAELLAGELGEKEGIILLQVNLGFVYLHLGKYDQSAQLFLNNLAACQSMEHLQEDLALCLLGLAGLLVSLARAPLAAGILGALDGHRQQLSLWPTDRSEYERISASVKAQLGERQFHQLYREGQALSLSEAAQLVQAQGLKVKGKDVDRLQQLTKREVEILRLVAQGLSDAQVAERLVISPRTVNAHLTSVYRKLGLNSRAAATRFAIEHGLG